ncbi:ectoine hydroxylase [Nocardia abscessus]|uniref:ectoine hydroxylase n=1 Tax=Nocardia TaxID=1817 RepID=UPI0018955CCA|nr:MULTISPECIES: ectoine hydroxylase [Nocardia]MBF6221643.1 ectoine hydroxylase [Nocardia abscessus]MDE1674026.1 ectoine hydroxylase [Nocardia gipuzkoensis]
MVLQHTETRPETARYDRYPTRLGAPAPHLERADPAVWGEVESPELASFDADGFAILDQLLTSDEVTEFSGEISRLASDPALREDDRVIVEKSSNRVRSVFEVHKLSEAIADLVRQPRVLQLAEQVLGSPVYVHQSRVNYMPGFRGTGFYWHSDFETWHAEDGMPAPRAVSLSIALTDNYPINGSLMVMPGSHHTFVPCLGSTPAEHYRESLQEQEIGVPTTDDITALANRYGISQFTGRAGSALLFDSNLMHGSSNNITPFPRSNIFVVFNSVHNTLVEPFAAPAPRPGYIGSRDFTPLSA